MDDLEDAKQRARRIVATTDVTADELIAYLALEAKEIEATDITEARDRYGLDIGTTGNGAGALQSRVQEALREAE